MSYLLGIDIGISSAKAVLFDPDAAAMSAVASREYPIHKPTPDRAEQDPHDWWQTTIASVRQALMQVEKPEIIAISLTGQMHVRSLQQLSGQINAVSKAALNLPIC